jgi:transposase
MKLYGAIDLHSTNNVTAVINEQDQVVYQKRFPNDLSLIVQQLSGYQASLEGIVVESTYNWYWLVDGLMEKGHRLHLANRVWATVRPPAEFTFFFPFDYSIDCRADARSRG